MKKIRFGSFPMTNIDADERQCIDTYSMKNFADLITMSTSMGNIRSSEQQFITPDVIMKFFKNNQNLDYSDSLLLAGPDTTGANGKVQTIKRAFNALKDFNKTLNGNPFYKNRKTLSIYLETENRNGSHDYDFLLLVNDLIPREILDEITYSDQLSLMFLVLKDQLFSNVKMSRLGLDGNSGDIKGAVAQFIEFSKNNKMDPITAMSSIIKLAGAKKLKEKSGYGGLVNLVGATVSGSISNKLNKMFRDGQIKDVHYLLNTIKHEDISNFFNDMDGSRQSSDINTKTLNAATMKSRSVKDSNFRSHTSAQKTGENYLQSSELERKYLMAKSQEYNKVLSIIDSLMIFNKQDTVLENMDEIKDMVIGSEGDQKSFNSVKLIENVQQVLYEEFVGTIVKKTNTYFVQKIGKPKTDKSSMTKEELIIQDIKDQITALKEEISLRDINNPNDEQQIEIARQQINMLSKELSDVNLVKLMNPNLDKNGREKSRVETSILQYDIDLIQSDFVMILQDLEKSLIDQKIVAQLYEKGSDKASFSNLDIWKNTNISRGQLENSIKDSMIDSYINSVSNDEDAIEGFRKTLDDKVLQDIIEKQLENLLIKLNRNLKSLLDNTISSYSDSRITRNPIISKTTGHASNFKTYIFSEELMDNLYTALNYLDTQKYLAGLLARTPVKINNPLNKYEYLIKRLGLQDNPIFIISEKSRTIILGSPDYLSLTGSSMMSRIRMDDMIKVCRIDYTRDIWDNTQMFKQLGINAKYNSLQDARNIMQSNEKNVDDIFAKIQVIMGNGKFKDLNADDKASVNSLNIKKQAAISNYNKSYNTYDKRRNDIDQQKEKYVNVHQQLGTSESDVGQQQLAPTVNHDFGNVNQRKWQDQVNKNNNNNNNNKNKNKNNQNRNNNNYNNQNNNRNNNYNNQNNQGN